MYRYQHVTVSGCFIHKNSIRHISNFFSVYTIYTKLDIISVSGIYNITLKITCFEKAIDGNYRIL